MSVSDEMKAKKFDTGIKYSPNKWWYNANDIHFPGEAILLDTGMYQINGGAGYPTIRYPEGFGNDKSGLNLNGGPLAYIDLIPDGQEGTNPSQWVKFEFSKDPETKKDGYTITVNTVYKGEKKSSKFPEEGTLSMDNFKSDFDFFAYYVENKDLSTFLYGRGDEQPVQETSAPAAKTEKEFSEEVIKALKDDPNKEDYTQRHSADVRSAAYNIRRLHDKEFPLTQEEERVIRSFINERGLNKVSRDYAVGAFEEIKREDVIAALKDSAALKANRKDYAKKYSDDVKMAVYDIKSLSDKDNLPNPEKRKSIESSLREQGLADIAYKYEHKGIEALDLDQAGAEFQKNVIAALKDSAALDSIQKDYDQKYTLHLSTTVLLIEWLSDKDNQPQPETIESIKKHLDEHGLTEFAEEYKVKGIEAFGPIPGDETPAPAPEAPAPVPAPEAPAPAPPPAEEYSAETRGKDPYNTIVHGGTYESGLDYDPFTGKPLSQPAPAPAPAAPAQETPASEAETGELVITALERMSVFSGNPSETNVMSVPAPEINIPTSEEKVSPFLGRISQDTGLNA